jgi:5-methylcytosine-specific restriction endonuclease McrA
MLLHRSLALLLVLVAVGLAASLFAGSAPASQHTCSDYPNQAAAQRAHDTRDADHDGVYCESLPCPCAGPSGSGGGSGQSGGGTPRGLGRSVTLGPVTRRSGCHVRGPLPDAGCTPGTRFSRVTKARVCRSGYSQSVRSVPKSTKDAVYRAYGMSRHFDGRSGEVDHLVSLELGGTNARSNLFPEAATPRPGSHEKDKLENRLHAEVCSGRITLRRAQHLIATDWLAAYHERFG